MCINPANGGKIEKPLVIDVFDLQADFIGMPHQHHLGTILALTCNKAVDITQYITADLTVGSNVVTKQSLGGLFIARGAGGGQQLFQKNQ